MSSSAWTGSWSQLIMPWNDDNKSLQVTCDDQSDVKIVIDKVEGDKFIRVEVTSKDERGQHIVSQFAIPNSVLKALRKFGKEEK